MSNIAFIFYSRGVDLDLTYYYGQIAEAFHSRHNVLAVNTWVEGCKNSFISQIAEDKIINFKPNLIISFNNVISERIYKNTNCPVLIIEADTYDVFANKTLITKYIERNYIGIARKNRFKLFSNIFPDFAKQNRFIHFKNSTILKLKQINQDINISIIGTIMGLSPKNAVVRFIQENIGNNEAFAKLNEIINKARFNIHNLTQEDYDLLKSNHIDFFYFLSYLNRVKTLDAVSDLGLKTFGQFIGIDKIISGLPLFITTLQKDKIITKEENSLIYNRSKISLNIHFGHNTLDESASAYSWRVCDVMATNACLVSTYCPAIKEDFEKWVKIPMFESRNEAYNLCKKLLEEENLRKDIVLGSQLAIKEGNFSFYDRLKEVEELFSLKPCTSRLEIFHSNKHSSVIINAKKILKKFEKRFIRPIFKKI
jgi:hypothetical protein